MYHENGKNTFQRNKKNSKKILKDKKTKGTKKEGKAKEIFR
jgi:hypothetical protein